MSTSFAIAPYVLFDHQVEHPSERREKKKKKKKGGVIKGKKEEREDQTTCSFRSPICLNGFYVMERGERGGEEKPASRGREKGEEGKRGGIASGLFRLFPWWADGRSIGRGKKRGKKKSGEKRKKEKTSVMINRCTGGRGKGERGGRGEVFPGEKGRKEGGERRKEERSEAAGKTAKVPFPDCMRKFEAPTPRKGRREKKNGGRGDREPPSCAFFEGEKGEGKKFRRGKGKEREGVVVRLHSPSFRCRCRREKEGEKSIREKKKGEPLKSSIFVRLLIARKRGGKGEKSGEGRKRMTVVGNEEKKKSLFGKKKKERKPNPRVSARRRISCSPSKGEKKRKKKPPGKRRG